MTQTVTAAGILAEVIDVTPEQAAEWLTKNKVNRSVRVRKVDEFAADMGKGNWQLTGEAIKFSHTGRLLDGQHRLLASVKSGSTFCTLVLFGIEDKSQRVMDIGAKRSVADHLGMLGYKHAALLASIAKMVIVYERGLLYRDRAQWGVTTSDVEDLVAERDELQVLAGTAHRLSTKIDATPTVIGTAMWLTRRSDPKASEVFWTALATMANLDQGSPILALAHRLAEVRRANVRLDTVAALSLFIRTWNSWRQGRTVQKMPIYKGGKAVRFSYVA